jgi:hypothetical protein
MKSQLWAKRKMRWATMASFRKVKANCGLRDKENGQLWPLLENNQLWARRRKMGNCDLF